jgi:uncharacterized membrane protein YcaP (DUF421 family)
MIKGHRRLLISNGIINETNLMHSHISREDLLEELRLNANCDDISKVKAAYKERSGEVGVVLRRPAPCSIDVGVVDGVQTVRIEL